MEQLPGVEDDLREVAAVRARAPLSAVLSPAILLGLAFLCFVLDQAILYAAWLTEHIALGLVLASVFGVFVPVLAACRWVSVRPSAGLLLRPLSRRQAFLALALTAACLAPTYVVGVVSQRMFPPGEDAFAFYEALVPNGLGSTLLGGAAVAVVAPLAEEVLFRSLTLGALGRLLPVTAAVLLQAVLFGIAHGALWLLAPITFLGFLLGWLMRRTGNLTSTWLTHGIVNGIAYVDLCFTHDVRGTRLERWAMHPEVLWPSLIALGALLVWQRHARPELPSTDSAMRDSADLRTHIVEHDETDTWRGTDH